MISRLQYVERILGPLHKKPAKNDNGAAFMPSNIALVKYWGKRPGPLNLPLVSSLSYTLNGFGTKTEINLGSVDSVEMNGSALDAANADFIKIREFLDLFRAPGECFRVVTSNNIPTASGVASSASGFAALLAALLALKGWDVPLKAQTMLARLGSGSAARSFWPGLVLWHKGAREDGMDCYAEQHARKTAFGMAVLLLDQGKKTWSSREAMEISLKTSPLMPSWPQAQQRHLDAVLAARDFAEMGALVEENAVLFHETLRQSTPSIVFDNAATGECKAMVRSLRAGGLPVYFTQDAGAHLKLVFPLENKEEIGLKLQAEGIDYFMA